ncbi:MAG TPA: RidA family protein [Acidimicrobiales bacterium]|nr:RidA family protein [Acidimicrobiales bacterium]
MGRVDERLEELGLKLPGEVHLPPGVETPFQWVRVRGRRAFVSGHGALTADGSPLGPFGSVPSEVSLKEAQASARSAVLAVLASVKRAVGDLDRIVAWLMLFGNVNADPGYAQTTLVVNPASELLIDLYGPDAGSHARTAIGMAALPLNLPVILAAEVELTA